MSKIILVATLLFSTALAGCQSTGPNQAIGTGVGAVGGYAVGRALGGGAAGSALGAVAGALVGSEVGRNMDQNQVYTPPPRVIVQERPVYIERRAPIRRCEIVNQWDGRIGAYRQVQICR
jgi:osmotically inducible lipoprotein OsmB